MIKQNIGLLFIFPYSKIVYSEECAFLMTYHMQGDNGVPSTIKKAKLVILFNQYFHHSSVNRKDTIYKENRKWSRPKINVRAQRGT